MKILSQDKVDTILRRLAMISQSRMHQRDKVFQDGVPSMVKCEKQDK